MDKSVPDKNYKYTNALINESSPYLLQHAHNPVNWNSWNDEILSKAKNENKLLLISIGYSACHWCHVMEKESFEDEEVASLMNEHFICIKVDREERPDVDLIYMNAVQLLTRGGGWPLNCFALPDGKPFWGGTYFRKQDWIELLKKITLLYKERKSDLIDQAETITNAIKDDEIISKNKVSESINKNHLKAFYKSFKQLFDSENGGSKGAPKFPMPVNSLFLLRYYYLTKDKDILTHLELTLTKMAHGGIYDQIGGGFSRYSTDVYWKVPHFEKMLYDNAQLVSLYAEAFQLTKNELYKSVISETLEFINNELTSKEGLFFSSLDADSENEEGKYYVWTQQEIENILGKNSKIFCDFFQVDSFGLWEEEKNILLRNCSEKKFAADNYIDIEEFKILLKQSKAELLNTRNNRVKPALDDKILTSWNALMLKGYIDAYLALKEILYLQKALKNANAILELLIKPDGGLYHCFKNKKSSINGFLEDYCFVIDAFINLYQATFDEKWLTEATKLVEYTITHFYADNKHLFYFTSDEANDIIARKTEVFDNVVPSSNAVMAINLYHLGLILNEDKYLEIVNKMLNNIFEELLTHPTMYAKWGILLLSKAFPFYTVAISGKNALAIANDINKHYIPQKILAGSSKQSNINLFLNKFVENETIIYVCSEDNCKLPVKEVEKAIEQLIY